MLLVALSSAIAPSFAESATGSSPVTIDTCAFGREGTTDPPRLGFGVEFTNASNRVITDIKFHFVFMTKFNEPLMGTTVTDSGVFSPNVMIDHRRRDVTKQVLFGGGKPLGTYYWAGNNTSNQSPDTMKMSCDVEAVSFQDGSVYHATPPPVDSDHPKTGASDAKAAMARPAAAPATSLANRHRTTVTLSQRAYAPIPESAVPDAILRDFQHKLARTGDILVAADTCQSTAQYKGLIGWYAVEPALADVDKANGITSKIFYEYKVKFFRPNPRQDWSDIGDDFYSNDGAPYQAVYEQREGSPTVHPGGTPCM